MLLRPVDISSLKLSAILESKLKIYFIQKKSSYIATIRPKGLTPSPNFPQRVDILGSLYVWSGASSYKGGGAKNEHFLLPP